MHKEELIVNMVMERYHRSEQGYGGSRCDVTTVAPGGQDRRVFPAC